MPQKQKSFSGFSPAAIQFLVEVREKNSKSWFEENKTQYQQLLLEPFQLLVSELTPIALSIDENFETRPAVNKSISRIYRDTRFSKDKSLYRNSMWLVFKRPGKDWIDAPGYFFEITPEFYRYGMGYYTASKNTMDTLREFIDSAPEQFLNLISFFSKQKIFTLEGEKYKRLLPNSYPAEVQEWYQRKTFFLVANRSFDDTLYSPCLVSELSAGFQMTGTLYQFLRNLKRT